MKTDLSFLPGKKQRELASIVEIIKQASSNVQMIILFGSHARGDFKEPWDIDVKAKSGHVSDYDILIITGTAKGAKHYSPWRKTKLTCNELGFSSYVQIIAHDIDFINWRLSEGHFFFSDIKKEGIMLYDSGKHTLAQAAKLTNEDRRRIAQEHYERWFLLAEDFGAAFEFSMEKPRYRLAAFNLHQAAEHALKAAGLVLTNYIPQDHLLETLGRYVGKSNPDFLEIFPIETKEDKELFKLLEYAYIGARYDKDYKITTEQLNKLSPCVKKLLTLTDTVCTEKIKSFEDG